MGDKFDFNAALEDCKLVRDGIKSDEDFQNADSGLVLYYLNTIVRALEIAATVEQGKWISCSEMKAPPRKQGRWIKGMLDGDGYHCSECRIWKKHIVTAHYCPNCGAEMNGGDN